MFAGYYCADQVQRYRASPHKPRIDHVAQALVGRQYLKEVVEQHLREWLRFTADCDARGIVVPPTVHAPEVQEYVARRLPQGSASRRRFVRASVRIFLETDADGVFRRRIGTAVAPAVPVWIQPALRRTPRFSGRIGASPRARCTSASGSWRASPTSGTTQGWRRCRSWVSHTFSNSFFSSCVRSRRPGGRLASRSGVSCGGHTKRAGCRRISERR